MQFMGGMDRFIPETGPLERKFRNLKILVLWMQESKRFGRYCYYGCYCLPEGSHKDTLHVLNQTNTREKSPASQLEKRVITLLENFSLMSVIVPFCDRNSSKNTKINFAL